MKHYSKLSEMEQVKLHKSIWSGIAKTTSFPVDGKRKEAYLCVIGETEYLIVMDQEDWDDFEITDDSDSDDFYDSYGTSSFMFDNVYDS